MFGSIIEQVYRFDDFSPVIAQDILETGGLEPRRNIDSAKRRLGNGPPRRRECTTGFKRHFSSFIEHVLDTRQALNNLIDLVRVDGHLMIHTPCNGYFGHGLHTLSPECILGTLEINGFTVQYRKFSTPEGLQIDDPGSVHDALIWVVARTREELTEFRVPQQGKWRGSYA